MAPSHHLNQCWLLITEARWHWAEGNFSETLYSDFIMRVMVSQVTGISIVCSAICSGADQRKHHSSALLVFVTGIHRSLENSLHKGPVTWKMFPFDDVIMCSRYHSQNSFENYTSETTATYCSSENLTFSCNIYHCWDIIYLLILSTSSMECHKWNLVWPV